MADAIQGFSPKNADRIARVVKTVEGMGPVAGGGGFGPVFRGNIGRWAKITGCTLATGYANVQFCSGNPGGTLTPDTSLTFKAFIGINSWWRKDDFVLLMPAASPDVHWVAVAGVNGPKFWEPPGTTYAGCRDGTLAANQDCPNAEVYCTDVVAVP